MGQAQGSELPYDIGDKFSCLSSKTIWSVHAGKKQVSVEFRASVATLAKAACTIGIDRKVESL